MDKDYQQQILDLLEREGLSRPAKTNVLADESILFDFSTLAQEQFMQDGFVFGLAPRREGIPYFDSATDTVEVARFGAAVSDSIWRGLESVTLGAIQNRSAIAKLPKSGRTLRSPTFELQHGSVHCLVEGRGHIVACVDSHRLVAGPLHKQTIVPVKANARWVKLNLDRYVGHRLHLEFIPATDAELSVRLVTQGNGAQEIADLDRRLRAGDEKLEQYANAAEAILNSGPIETEDRLFADFESGTYDGWTVTGNAFGAVPQTLDTIASSQKRINAEGRFFVNSHNIRRRDADGTVARRGDELTGTMTSQEFTIDFDSIEFLVGGGSHQGKTCVNLVVDGETKLSATGNNNNKMSLNVWNVRPYAGQRARIQIVDDHRGGWGNIGLDQIVFKTKIKKSENDNRAAHRLVEAWQRDRERLSSQIVRKSRVALAMMDGSGEDDRVLIRGNSSKPGKVEPRHFLTAVTGNTPMAISRGSGRLELAEAINDPMNPLSSRVIVNRLWHHLMGRGIVPTTDDFGFLGQRPTHPQLLDHLASRFLADGRSLKRMIKYIVLSRTYRMTGDADPDAVQADANNLLWHHRPSRRLQGEAIRDSLLSVSGQLNPTAFGPPVPIHLTSFMDGRGRPNKNGPLDGDRRRSIYIAVRRNFLSPMMLAFDTPVPFSAMGRRNVSNVPAQPLILLNDPLVAELSRKWGNRALETVAGKDPEATSRRVEWMYLSGFARPPTPQERDIAVSFVTSRASDRGVESDDADLWKTLAHVLVNTKEFIFLR
ncbi:MAG: DUF1553 domain-containing protein [Planctomycetota bacterium]